MFETVYVRVQANAHRREKSQNWALNLQILIDSFDCQHHAIRKGCQETYVKKLTEYEMYHDKNCYLS